MKNKKWWMFVFPCMYILLTCLILIEAKMPGNESSSQSKLFANLFDVGPKQAEIIHPISVSMEKETYEMEIGDSVVLNPVFSPENTTDQRVDYLYDNESSPVEISQNTMIADKEGETEIKVQGVEVSSSFRVKVSKRRIHKLEGHLKTESNLVLGMTSKLDVQADKADFNLDEIRFVSTNPDVATVSESGIIYTCGYGRTDIYACSIEDSSVQTEKFSLIVEEGKFVRPTKIQYDESITMYVGEKKEIRPVFNQDCSDTAIQIRKEANIQVCDETIVPEKEGNYDIHIESIGNPDVSTTFHLTVLEVKPLSIDVSFSSLQYGKTEKLSYSLVSEKENLPVTYPEVGFKVDDSSICNIDESGYLVGYKKGSVRITVYWLRNPKIEGTATIAITAMDGEKFDHINYIVRKVIGHFGVFLLDAVFGILTVFFFFGKGKRKYVLSLVFLILGLLIAMFSEFLQINAGNRGPSWNDVGIDFSGYFLGAIVTFAICFFVQLKKKKQ